jgi:hypothetical protein
VGVNEFAPLGFGASTVGETDSVGESGGGGGVVAVVVVVVWVFDVVVAGLLFPWPPHPASANTAIPALTAIPPRRAAKRTDAMRSVLSMLRFAGCQI